MKPLPAYRAQALSGDPAARAAFAGSALAASQQSVGEQYFEGAEQEALDRELKAVDGFACRCRLRTSSPTWRGPAKASAGCTSFGADPDPPPAHAARCRQLSRAARADGAGPRPGHRSGGAQGRARHGAPAGTAAIRRGTWDSCRTSCSGLAAWSSIPACTPSTGPARKPSILGYRLPKLSATS